MNWIKYEDRLPEDDPYREAKDEIFELIRNALAKCHADKLTVKDLTDAIDDFFIKICKED